MTVKLYANGKPQVFENVRSIRERADAYRLHINGKGTVHLSKKTTNRVRITTMKEQA